MPAVIYGLKVDSITAGVLNTGDTLNISPKSTAKTSSGAGGLNTGDLTYTNTIYSITNTIDPDVSDENIASIN
nr:spore germination protein [Tuberibacillus sp. Marseille-P3662]